MRLDWFGCDHLARDLARARMEARCYQFTTILVTTGALLLLGIVLATR